jgi:hypothetical protein
LGAGSTNASVAASYSLSATTLTTTTQGSAETSPSAGDIPLIGPSNYAVANASITLNLDTEGAVRPGYVLIDWNASGNSCCGTGWGSVTYGIGTAFSGNCGAPPLAFCSYSVLEPITLGIDFIFTETEQFEATAQDDQDGGSLQSSLTLQFSDANGGPVNVFETPEPCSADLAAAGLLVGLLWTCYRAQRARQRDQTARVSPR